MALLTSYGDFNKKIDGEDKLRSTYFFGLVAEEKIDTVTYTRYTGMTYDAAVICRDDLHDPGGTPPTIAQLKRQMDCGMYMVSVVEYVEGAWTPIGAA